MNKNEKITIIFYEAEVILQPKHIRIERTHAYHQGRCLSRN